MSNTERYFLWMRDTIKNKYVNVPELMIPALRKIALNK